MDHTSLDKPIPGTEGGKEIAKDALHDETAYCWKKRLLIVLHGRIYRRV